jgi:hypothetical protein
MKSTFMTDKAVFIFYGIKMNICLVAKTKIATQKVLGTTNYAFETVTFLLCTVSEYGPVRKHPN